MRCSTCVNGDGEGCHCIQGLFSRLRGPARQETRSVRQGQQASTSPSRDPTNVPAASGSGRGEQASGRGTPAQQAIRGSQAAQTQLMEQQATRDLQTSRSNVGGLQPVLGARPSQSGSTRQQSGGSASRGESQSVRSSRAPRSGSTQEHVTHPAGGRETSTASRVCGALSDLPCRDTAPSCEWKENSKSGGEAQPKPAPAGQSDKLQARRVFFKEPPISAPYTTKFPGEPEGGPKPVAPRWTRRVAVHTRIETEIMLAPKFSHQYNGPLGSFVEGIVELYNGQKPAEHPEMAEWWVEGELHPSDNNDVWLLGGFDDIAPTVNSPRRLRLTSPLLERLDNATREQVLTKTWAFLRQHYDIQGNIMESIKVHKLNGYLTPQIKVIAEAIIHFEPVLDRIIEELGPGQSKARNWRDNPHLGGANKSRSESIAAVKAVLSESGGHDHDELTDFLTGRPGINFYRWNFKQINKYATIQFTPGPECRTIDDALWWADFILTFVKAAMDSSRFPGQLQRYSPDYQGLRELLSGVREPADSGTHAWRPVRRVGV